jgi:hypothetical protein
MASAAQIAARKKFSDIMKSGGFKKNPLTRVKKNSPSMATGKAPSTRLKKRRAKTAKAPAGYYANPAIPSADYDYVMIDDIKFVAVNDAQLYRQQGYPIIENLAKKMAKGQFDTTKAIKLYSYLADAAVKNYSVKHMGSSKPTLTILSKPERQILAQNLFEYYADDIAEKSKEYSTTRRKNPTILITDTPKKRTVIRRVNPVKNLNNRPIKKNYAFFPYVVEVKQGKETNYSYHAGFKTRAEANNMAKLIKENYPDVMARVSRDY